MNDIQKLKNKIAELEQIQNAEPEVLEALPTEIQSLQRQIKRLEAAGS